MYIFVLIKDGDEWKKGVLAMKKTELKHGRTLQDMIRKFRYPDDETFGKYAGYESIYSRSFILTSKAESNDAGDWYNGNVEPGKILDPVADADVLSLADSSHRDALEDLPAPRPVAQLETADTEAF